MSTTYPPTLKTILDAAAPGPRGWDYRVLAYSGDNSTQIAAQIDAGLAGISYAEIGHVCINISINDAQDGTTQEDYETAMLYIIDAVHTRWPNAQQYLMRPWSVGETTDCNTMAGWIDNIVTARSAFVHLGPDERVFLENGDNGATYMGDTVHPNAAGYALTAVKWSEILLA